MSTTTHRHRPGDGDDERTLHKLGYAQVLFREMGGFSNFAISFTIISILAGCLTSYFIAFNNGGPVAVTWGWLLVGAFCILVAMAMGEIASAMPTAGALYYWASKLGGPVWGSVTSASRMLFAFSRDGAVPGWRILRRVSKRRVPRYAVAVICVLAWALMLPTLANAFIGYLVGTSIAVIGLYIAFAIPIYLRLRQGDRFEAGSWSLGKRYRWIGIIAVTWIILVCILFLMPVSPKGIPGNPDFTWEVVNYAPLTVGGAFILFGGWYLLSARQWFTGPVREAETEQELESIEKLLR